MVKNLSKADVSVSSKSTSILFTIALLAAELVDWVTLRTQWQAATGKLTQQIPLVESATADAWKSVDCGAGTVVPSIAGGESPYDGVATINAIAEGIDEATLDWAYNMQGEEVVAVVTRCSDGKKFVFANPCTGGLVFKYESIGSQDGGKAGIAFTLTGRDCPKPALVYEPGTQTNG